MEHVYWVSVIVLIAIAVLLMVNGEILGESTTGIATVLGIITLSLIAPQGRARRAIQAHTRQSR